MFSDREDSAKKRPKHIISRSSSDTELPAAKHPKNSATNTPSEVTTATMSTCLVCPPLACGMDCEASKQLVLPLNCEAERSYQSYTTDNPASATTATLAALHPTVVQIDQLPNELKTQIIGYLEPDLESIRNIRLVSRSWAFLGSPYLLDPTFNMLSNRDDMNRLVEIAQHPYFSQRIKKLAIKWASIDGEALRLELIAPYAGHSYDEDSFREYWGKWLKFKGLVDLYSDTFCDKDLLAICFNGLTNLNTLRVHPDHDPLELRQWFPVGHAFPGRANEETRKLCHNIFSIMSSSTTKISRLAWCADDLGDDSLDRPPGLQVPEGFPPIRDSIALIIPELKAFTFKIRYGRNSFCNIYEHKCSELFAKAAKLEYLMIQDARNSPGLGRNDTLAIKCPWLQSIHLILWDWPLSHIHQLLFTHRTTLKDVTIRMAFLQHVWEEDMQSLLNMMKKEMQLERLKFVFKDFSQIPIDLGCVLLEGPTAREELTGREAAVWDLKSEIEDYVIRDGPYPTFHVAEEAGDI